MFSSARNPRFGRSLRSLAGALLSCVAVAAVADVYSGGTTSGNLSVWRINEKTGQVSLCSFESKNSPASCAPWSQKESDGLYGLIAGNDVLSVWRINRKNGMVSQCEYRDVAKPPVCTPWG